MRRSGAKVETSEHPEQRVAGSAHVPHTSCGAQDGSAAGSIERPVAPLERRDEAKDEWVTVCVRALA